MILQALATTESVDLTSGQLEQCVQYFTNGGVAEWIVGGLTFAIFVYSSFSKKSLPQVVKQAPEFLMGKGKDFILKLKKKK